jgi:hypothetical protein
MPALPIAGSTVFVSAEVWHIPSGLPWVVQTPVQTSPAGIVIVFSRLSPCHGRFGRRRIGRRRPTLWVAAGTANIDTAASGCTCRQQNHNTDADFRIRRAESEGSRSCPGASACPRARYRVGWCDDRWCDNRWLQHCRILQPKRINKIRRAVPSVCVDVNSAAEPNRILADKPPKRRAVVSGPVLPACKIVLVNFHFMRPITSMHPEFLLIQTAGWADIFGMPFSRADTWTIQ